MENFSGGFAPRPPQFLYYFLPPNPKCAPRSLEGNGGTDKKGCSRCGKSRCQVCNVMSNSEHFHSNVDRRPPGLSEWY